MLLLVIISVQKNPDAWQFIFTTVILEVSGLLHNLNHHDEKSQMKNKQKVPVYFITDRCWIRILWLNRWRLLSFLLGTQEVNLCAFRLCEFGSWRAGASPSPRTNTPWYIMLTLAVFNTMNNTGIIQLHDHAKPGSPHSESVGGHGNWLPNGRNIG